MTSNASKTCFLSFCNCLCESTNKIIQNSPVSKFIRLKLYHENYFMKIIPDGNYIWVNFASNVFLYSTILVVFLLGGGGGEGACSNIFPFGILCTILSWNKQWCECQHDILYVPQKADPKKHQQICRCVTKYFK